MKLAAYDRDRAQRNLKPHAEASLAMALWSHEYAFEQRGGSMDFWDSRTPAQKRLCADIVSEVLKANEQNGRAALPASDSKEDTK